MTIAAERYLAVCQPFKHNEFTIRKLLLFYVLIYFMAVFINSIAAFEVSLLYTQVEAELLVCFATSPKFFPDNSRSA